MPAEGHGLRPEKPVPEPVDEIGELARVKATGEPPQEPVRSELLRIADEQTDDEKTE
jgi:hypothetical protein